MALNEQTPPQRAAAAAALEEVLADGFQGSAQAAVHDGIVQAAARWRVHLALITGDKATVLNVIQWVEQGNAGAELKAEFLRDHEAVAACLRRQRD